MPVGGGQQPEGELGQRSQRGPSHPGCRIAGASRRRCRVRRPARTCRRGQAKGLAEVLRGSRAIQGWPVSAVLLQRGQARDGEGLLVLEVPDLGRRDGQPERVAEQGAQPLVLDRVGQVHSAATASQTQRQLQDVRGGRGPERAPLTALCGAAARFLLRAGQRDAQPFSGGAPVPIARRAAVAGVISASRKGALSMRSQPSGTKSSGSSCTAPRSRAQWPATDQRPL